MNRQKRHTILDRTRPRIKTPAIGVMAQQGTDGKWTTVVQKGIVRICTINVGTMKGRSREVVEICWREEEWTSAVCKKRNTKERDVRFLGKERKDTSFYGWERRTREVD